MTQPTREAIYQALFATVSAMTFGSPPATWASAPSRRVKLWGDVDKALRPALFQFEGEPDGYRYGGLTTFSSQVRTIFAKLFCYFDAKDTNIIGATQLNNALDAFDAAFQPDDSQTGVFTLGGLVQQCRIARIDLKDPGDLDSDGLLIVSVEMILP